MNGSPERARRRNIDDMPKDTDRHGSLATAGLKDRIAFIAEVVAPTLAKGPLVRRPRVVSVAERLDLDARAVRRMAALRDAYGDGPLLVPVPGRTHAVILSPSDALRVLEETPDPFMPATDEKRAALAHFEPKVSLASRGAERVDRRRFNDRVLENDRPVHSMAEAMLPVVEEEAARLLRRAGRRLDWDAFIASWYRVVRRIVLGGEAGDDHELTDILETLRRKGNRVYLARKRRDLLDRFRARVENHLDRAEPGSLAERIAALPKSDATAPADQVAHYLFAFDPGGMATFRALALLAAHPGAVDRSRDEVAAADAGAGRAMLPFLRATLLESLRLWPTTPVILRQASRDVDFGGGTLPEGANVIVYAPFFHRDDALPFAHRFAPELWLADAIPAEGPARRVSTARAAPFALVPFSFGPGRCPASDLVPLIASAMLAAIVAARVPRLADPQVLRTDAPLPSLLDNYRLAFEIDA
jgi:cytochrome P450